MKWTRGTVAWMAGIGAVLLALAAPDTGARSGNQSLLLPLFPTPTPTPTAAPTPDLSGVLPGSGELLLRVNGGDALVAQVLGSYGLTELLGTPRMRSRGW